MRNGLVAAIIGAALLTLGRPSPADSPPCFRVLPGTPIPVAWIDPDSGHLVLFDPAASMIGCDEAGVDTHVTSLSNLPQLTQHKHAVNLAAGVDQCLVGPQQVTDPM